MTVRELRCPEHNFRLFGKILCKDGIKVDKETNTIEIKCRECTKYYNKKHDGDGEADVFHYFDGAGNFVETRIKKKEVK
jgi:hypothetical protein